MKMIRCKEICRRLEQELRQSQMLPVRVLSIYRHVVNLERKDGRLVSCMIAHEREMLVPYGMIVRSGLDLGTIKEGQEILLALPPASERIGVWVLDVAGAEIRDMKLGMRAALSGGREKSGRTPEKADEETAREMVGTYLREHVKERGIGEALEELKKGSAAAQDRSAATPGGYEGIARQQTADRLRCFLAYLTRLGQGELKASDRAACPNILGMGVGLTPASDDFMLGLLAAFQYAGDPRQVWLEDFISTYLETTTRISQDMLAHGICREYPSYILAFFEAEARGCMNCEILDAFYHHGHSSGMDTLHGIGVGLRMTVETGI